MTASPDSYEPFGFAWKLDDVMGLAVAANEAAGIPDPIVPTEPTCTRRLSSAHEDEDTYKCGRPATVEALTTAGQWEPHCEIHVQGWPTDRVRQPADAVEGS